MGYSMIAFISTLMLGNLILVIWFGALSVKYIFIKYYRIIRRFIDPDYMRPKIMLNFKPKKPKVPVLERHMIS